MICSGGDWAPLRSYTIVAEMLLITLDHVSGINYFMSIEIS